MDALILDTRIQNRYNLSVETVVEDPKKTHLRIYPQYHVNNRDPLVYNPNICEDPIDFFFKITITPNVQTCLFPSKHTIQVRVFSIETDTTEYGLTFSNRPQVGRSRERSVGFELHPWISREPNHTHTITLNDESTFNINDIRDYIAATSWNIRDKILKAIPEILDIHQHYCANCRAKLQGPVGWKHRN